MITFGEVLHCYRTEMQPGYLKHTHGKTLFWHCKILMHMSHSHNRWDGLRLWAFCTLPHSSICTTIFLSVKCLLLYSLLTLATFVKVLNYSCRWNSVRMSLAGIFRGFGMTSMPLPENQVSTSSPRTLQPYYSSNTM